MVNTLKMKLLKLKEDLKSLSDFFNIIHSLTPSIIPMITILKLLSSVSPFIAIILSSKIIDKLMDKRPLKETLTLMLIGISIILFVNFLVHTLGKFYNLKKEYFIRRYNMKIGEKMLSMDYEQLENPNTHLLKQRIIDDNSWGSGIWGMFYFYEYLVQCSFSFIISFIIIIKLFTNTQISKINNSFINSFGFTLIFIGIILILTINMSLINKTCSKNTFDYIDNLRYENCYSSYFMPQIENYKNGKDIRIYNIKTLIMSEINKSFTFTSKNIIPKICFSEGLRSSFNGMSTAFIGGLAYLFVALKASTGIFSIGNVIMYAGAIQQFISAFSEITINMSEFITNAKRLKNNTEFFNLPDVKYKGSLPVEKRNDNQYEIEFKNVSFKYPSTTVYVLKNVSLKLKIGERLAIVGMNGSGKTTFIKLLCRLYDPTDGEILLNGINIKKYDYKEYMTLFSVVFQDFKLFSFSAGENVATSVNFDENYAMECLEKAGIGERINSLPKGIHSSLYKNFDDDGIEISGGEAQKIAIARALYKNAPFIVLDEPTAALDPIAEFEIYSKFNEIVGNKTALYISHRLSSCRFCEDIVVFHEGKIIQRGNHDKLILDKTNKYYELWNAQAQYYND